jgi:hypothetical protein
MTDELERIWKEAFVAQSRYYPGILRVTCQDSRCAGRDSNQVPREYESTVSPLYQLARYLVLKYSVN